jgi:hypothetical protein
MTHAAVQVWCNLLKPRAQAPEKGVEKIKDKIGSCDGNEGGCVSTAAQDWPLELAELTD